MQFCSLLLPVISALDSVAKEMSSSVGNIGQMSVETKVMFNAQVFISDPNLVNSRTFQVTAPTFIM